ncbi:DUF5615 family PIN-like protein [Salinarimonas soli]|uniref:DUF5615 family PIN-like protein n=1 Tax=Salinarimonas soli TaxID=1638099 RepID=UPI001F0AF0E8|nr:DUF5615 family PIN-like protein [Salinarimonas soli]
MVDMNLSPLWCDVLQAHGHEAVHWRSLGPGHASDDVILAWAVEHGFDVLTADLDFAAAVTSRAMAAPSVVQLRAGSTDPDEVGAFVARSIAAAGSKLAGGAILTIERGQARLRTGPDQSPMTDEP